MKNTDMFEKIAKTQDVFRKIAKAQKNSAYANTLDKMRPYLEIQKSFAKNLSLIQFPKVDITNQLRSTVEAFKRFEDNWADINLKLKQQLEPAWKVSESIRNNSELQFASVMDLNLINVELTRGFVENLEKDNHDEYIQKKEAILNDNLLPFLDRLEIRHLWDGAYIVLDHKENPDRLRHAMTSLRTLLDHLIQLLAPNKLLKLEEEYKEKVKGNKVTRNERIRYFTSKIEFGLFKEFGEREINFICDCYDTMNKLHSTNIKYSENQVRVLMVKTGMTAWLLAHLYEVINKDNDIK